MTALEPLRDKIAGMIGKPAAWFLTEAPKYEDDLLNLKEDVLDKIRAFMGGTQKEIYDDVRDFVTAHEANISYVDAVAGERLRVTLADKDCYKGTVVQALKADLYTLKDKVDIQVLEERKAVVSAVEDCATKIAQTTEFQTLTSDQQGHINRSIESHKDGLDLVKMIPILRDRVNGARTSLMPQILAEISDLAQPAPAPAEPGGKSTDTSPVPPKAQAYVNASEVRITFAKPYLAEEADVEQYIDEMKKSLMAEIHQGKKVIV